MGKKYKLSIPKSLDYVTLEQYQKYVKVITENKDAIDDEFIKLKVLEIFCGVSLKEAYELAAVDIDQLVSLVLQVISQEPPLQRRFTMTDPSGKTMEFGFVPNLERISTGEYIDIEKNIVGWDNMHKAMAVLYRPITGSKGEFYEIEKYSGYTEFESVMKDAPASVAIGAMVFFYHLKIALLNATLNYSLNETKKDLQDLEQLETHSEGNGDGTVPYTHLLEETYSKLNQLRKSPYTNV